jgi:hypothetical protein
MRQSGGPSTSSREADQVLRLRPRLRHAVGLRGDAGQALALPAAAGLVGFAAARRIAVAEVEPQRPVGPQHAAQFAQHREQVVVIQLIRRLKAEAAAPRATELAKRARRRVQRDRDGLLCRVAPLAVAQPLFAFAFRAPTGAGNRGRRPRFAAVCRSRAAPNRAGW